jgi:F-type H+-transporting ATPase subunit epsilon
VSPNQVVYHGEATSVTAPGFLGSFQVLHSHAPLLARLVPGPVKIKDKAGSDSLYAVGGGFFEVRDNQVTILADSAEPAGEIDKARAQEARSKAEALLREPGPEDDVAAAREALARAVNRLHVAEKKP